MPQPQFVLVDGKPSFEITRYSTSGDDNGAGFCRFDVELTVPQAIETAVAAQIPSRFPNARQPYNFQTPDYNRGGKAYFAFESGSSKITFSAPVSEYGSNVASFLLPMTKAQLDTLVGALSKPSGGAFEVSYHVSVPARLPAVTATLSFDSSIAFAYQVTQPSFDSWGDETSPGSVSELLKESASSKVDISWGTSTPSADLRQAVADWANGTLADLVSAEVQKTIALQGLTSGQSFNINEVSSFTSTYSENMVIDWIVSPTAALPTFPSQGLDIGQFTSSVNEQQQVMTVSAFLPFKDAGKGMSEVDHVTVTVSYPGLPQADATYVFESNSTHAFTAAYDETAGPNWSLDYVVTYVSTATPPVQGTVAKITTGSYTLQVEQAGILSVVFDASQAFATETQPPDHIDVSLSYIDAGGHGSLINETVTISGSDTGHRKTISSIYAMPIDSTYNYEVTYVFTGSVTYTAPLVANQTGFLQLVPAADAASSCSLIVYVPASQAAGSPIFEADVKMWYSTPPTLPPAVGTQPTKASPATFKVTPASDKVGNLFGRATFVGLVTGDEPLVYTATIDAAAGQIVVGETLIENAMASIMVTPTQRYFTLEINPGAIDWATATFKSVQVIVTGTIAQGSASSAPTQPAPAQSPFTWTKGQTGSQYLTWSTSEGNTVSYELDGHVRHAGRDPAGGHGLRRHVGHPRRPAAAGRGARRAGRGRGLRPRRSDELAARDPRGRLTARHLERRTGARGVVRAVA